VKVPEPLLGDFPEAGRGTVVGVFLEGLLTLPPGLVYLVVGALVFAEDAIFVGFVLPGETAAILGGVAASQGHASLAGMLLIVVLAAVVGDSVGYEVGKQLGPRILGISLLRRRADQLERARSFLARRGGVAVFLGRFTAFFRAVMPALAGIAQMPYRRFLVFNVAGGLVWGAGVVLLGFLAGNSYEAVERVAGRAVAVALVVVVLAGLVAWHLRRRRRERRVTRA
jgi:membrane protein DedA with SNARE-associated domain